MKLFKEKKGIFFTILALVISVFILLMFFYMMELPVDHGVEVTRTKVRTVNNVLSQVESFTKAHAVASSRETINHLMEKMYDDNKFFDDFDDDFLKCMDDGCGGLSGFKNFIEDNLSDFLIEHVGLNTEINISNIELDQKNHWELEISFHLDIIVKEENFAWEISTIISESFSILGFRDPVHVVVDESIKSYRQDFDNVTRIKHHKMYKEVGGWLEKPSTLNEILKERAFFEYEGAPSFINRLRGNMTSSTLGIVSVVPTIYTNEKDDTTFIRSGSSNLDWHFWQDETQNGVLFGEYNFTSVEDIVSVLSESALNFSDNYSNNLHRAIVPVFLAIQGNASGSSYFYFDGNIDEFIEIEVHEINTDNLEDNLTISFKGYIEEIQIISIFVIDKDTAFEGRPKGKKAYWDDKDLLDFLKQSLENGDVEIELKIKFTDSIEYKARIRTMNVSIEGDDFNQDSGLVMPK